MLYWYIRSVLSDNSSLKKRDIWHLVPMIIFFAAALPNAFIPWHEKVEIARKVVENTGFINEYRATLIAKTFSPSLEFLIRPVLVMGYTIWSAGLCINYMINNKLSAVFTKQLFMKKWLCMLLTFLLTLEITQILLIIRGFEMHFSELYFGVNIIRAITVTGLMGLIISPFFFPSILYGLPRLPESVIERNTEKRLTQLEQSKKIPNHNHFENSYLHAIGQKTDACMKEHKPYLQPECNLTHLAKHVNLPAHHLAYYFREVKKQTFNDYRNEWRINHAKKLIEEGKASEMTLEAIGMLSGFSSRNAFITDFKKTEGVSPGAYASRLN
jgi:AraC-like DNA-binding protein